VQALGNGSTRRRAARLAPAAVALAALLGGTTLLRAAIEDPAARLGADLTPVGAERAGNAEGTIPEWTGGVTAMPPGWQPGLPRVDIFADDRPLFSIDADNADQHADKLTEGQLSLLRTYEGFRMDVYPTRRSCALPESIYRDVKRNVTTARVDDECNLVAGIRSPLFPTPKNGCEVSWNGKMAVFNGIVGYDRMEATIVPTRGGSFVPVRRRQVLYFRLNKPENDSYEALDGILAKSISHTISPPKTAGEITLVHALASGSLRAWIYNPGQRRVRRAPNFEYDNPVPGWQGLVTVDQVNGFVGAGDRYDWKLLGKRELYVPYNNTRIHDKSLSYDDIVEPRFPRRDLVRYELHRVWVVEANVRSDRRHVMPKRVFYLDEDSWLIVLSDNYDRRDRIWRVTEHLPELLYEIPSCVSNTSFYYDLVAGRYVISPLFNEEEESDYLAGHTGKVKDDGFTPDDVRRLGRR
jgi:hypothetical protein